MTPQEERYYVGCLLAIMKAKDVAEGLRESASLTIYKSSEYDAARQEALALADGLESQARVFETFLKMSGVPLR